MEAMGLRLIDADALKIRFRQEMANGKPEVNPRWKPVFNALCEDCCDIIDEQPEIDADRRAVFDLLYDLSCANYGKQLYSLQDNGTVYSRYSCGYMTLEEAVEEFKDMIRGDI